MDPAEQVLMLASRNSGKSAITEMYATWLLHRNPLDIIGVISGSSRRAKRTLRTVRQFISNCPLLVDLVPNDSCLDAADQFVVPDANGKLGSSVSFSSFGIARSEEHTSELQSLMRISYAVFCLKKKNNIRK